MLMFYRRGVVRTSGGPLDCLFHETVDGELRSLTGLEHPNSRILSEFTSIINIA